MGVESGESPHRPQIYWDAALLSDAEADRSRVALKRVESEGGEISDPIVQAADDAMEPFNWTATLHCFAKDAMADGVSLLKYLGEDLRKYPEIWDLLDEGDLDSVKALGDEFIDKKPTE